MISQTQINEDIIESALKSGRVTLSILMKLLGSSPIQLQCVQLRFINNKSYQEIAQIRKCFTAAARLNVKYGMDKIIKYLEDEAITSLVRGEHPTADTVDTFEGSFTEEKLDKLVQLIKDGEVE